MSRVAWAVGACVASAVLAYWPGGRGVSKPASPVLAQPGAATPHVTPRSTPVRFEVTPSGGLTADDRGLLEQVDRGL